HRCRRGQGRRRRQGCRRRQAGQAHEPRRDGGGVHRVVRRRVPGVQQVRAAGVGLLGGDHLVRPVPAGARRARPGPRGHRASGEVARSGGLRATVSGGGGGGPMTTRRDAPRLGALESQVMELLWDGGPSTIRELIGSLPGSPAYTTIATVLTNLQRKGLAASRKKGRSTVYRASCTREQHVASMMSDALGSSRDRAASILHFAESMPESELDLLRDFLAQRDGGAP